MDASRIPITPTKEGASDRDVAIAVIADKLNIDKTKVTDGTELGDHWYEITMVVAFKLDKILESHTGMKAGDLFAQL